MKFRFVATSFARGYGVQRKEKLEKIPKAPGVYALNAGREILYIGKAANLRERIKNHFQRASYRDNLFIHKVTRVGWVETQSDIDALLLESQLIKEYQPRYNVLWKDDKKYFSVAITKEKLPRIFLTHQPQPKTIMIGPFVEGRTIKQVLRLLRKVFPYYAAKKHSSLPCPYCHLNLCPGPNPNPKEYRKNIKNLAAVLQGKKTSVWKNLNKEMGEAAKFQKYEEAAKLRDQIGALERVFAHRHAVVQLEQPQDYYESTEKQLRTLLGSKKRIRRVEAYDISNTQGQQATGSMVTFLAGKPAKEWYRKFKIHITGKPNDFAMMQELVSRRLNHPEWPYPDLMVIDGGKPQLTAALAALRKSEIRNPKSEILLAALAKRHNELFSPGNSKPLLLKNLSQKVSNLLLYIRDEAHRFAITYHRKLRKIDAIGTS